jgi:hypothetical protein
MKEDILRFQILFVIIGGLISFSVFLLVFICGATHADNLKFGNCHVYAWLKFITEGGNVIVEPSEKNTFIPHSYHMKEGVRSEYVPVSPKHGWFSLIHSLGFVGRVKTNSMERRSTDISASA